MVVPRTFNCMTLKLETIPYWLVPFAHSLIHTLLRTLYWLVYTLTHTLLRKLYWLLYSLTHTLLRTLSWLVYTLSLTLLCAHFTGSLHTLAFTLFCAYFTAFLHTLAFTLFCAHITDYLKCCCLFCIPLRSYAFQFLGSVVFWWINWLGKCSICKTVDCSIWEG